MAGPDNYPTTSWWADAKTPAEFYDRAKAQLERMRSSRNGKPDPRTGQES